MGEFGWKSSEKKIKNLTGKKKPLENTKREIERERYAHTIFLYG